MIERGAKQQIAENHENARAEARRAGILAAAQALFMQLGLRATTMEAIAREAGVAKPTLYHYFSDKEAVYRAVVASFLVQMKAIFAAELARQGEIAEVVGAALLAKHRYVRSFLANAPYGAELYSEKSRLAGVEIAALEDWLAERLSARMQAAGRANCAELATIILGATAGLADKSPRDEQLSRRIIFVVKRLLG